MQRRSVWARWAMIPLAAVSLGSLYHIGKGCRRSIWQRHHSTEPVPALAVHLVWSLSR
jgi:hypothetical protein